MSMSSQMPILVRTAEEVTQELPMPTWAYGAIALAVVFLLLIVVWLFRNTAQAMYGGHDTAAAHGTGDAHHGRADARGHAGGRAGH